MNLKHETVQYIEILENMCNFCKPSAGYFGETTVTMILQANIF